MSAELASGTRPMRAPAPTATPFPPLKPVQTGKTWPMMASAAAAMGHHDPPTSHSAMSTAAAPLAISSTMTVMPAVRPSVRKTLVAPRLPLPSFRRSTPWTFPARSAKGMEPSR